MSPNVLRRFCSERRDFAFFTNVVKSSALKTNCVPDFVTNLGIPTLNEAVEFNVKTSVHLASVVSKLFVVVK